MAKGKNEQPALSENDFFANNENKKTGNGGGSASLSNELAQHYADNGIKPAHGLTMLDKAGIEYSDGRTLVQSTNGLSVKSLNENDAVENEISAIVCKQRAFDEYDADLSVYQRWGYMVLPTDKPENVENDITLVWGDHSRLIGKLPKWVKVNDQRSAKAKNDKSGKHEYEQAK